MPFRTARLFAAVFGLAALTAISAAPVVEAAPETARAAAIVNDSVITTYDIQQRMMLVIASSGQRPSADALDRIRDQVLRTLIDELLQLQEAQKLKIEVAQDEMLKAMERIAKQNNATVASIKEMLDTNGISQQTLLVQIKAELAWAKIINMKIAPRITISPDEVEETYRRIAESASKPQFHVAEIYLAVDTPEQEDEVRQALEQIYAALQSGTAFPVIARQVSQSATAAQGGDLGWVTEGQLPELLNSALVDMYPGQISEPIRASGGYYILAMRERRERAGVVVEAPPPPEPPQRPAGVPAGYVKLMQVTVRASLQSMSEEQKRQVLAMVRDMHSKITGCQGLSELVKQYPNSGVQSFGTLRLADLQPELAQMLGSLNPSDASQPFGTPGGIAFFVVCGDRAKVPPPPETQAFEMPTREDVENRLYNAQVSMLARRYMRDLRRDATIEIRPTS